MNKLAVEVTESETERFNPDTLSFKVVKGSNFDGAVVNTILISLTSATTIKAVIDVLRDVVKQRKSGKIKINGIEISNVSEEVILKALDRK